MAVTILQPTRTRVILSLSRVVAIAVEALVTLTKKVGTAVTSTGTSYTVTAGKTLRIQAIILSIINVTTATAPIAVVVRLREGAAAGGVVSVASDVIAQLETGVPMGTATLNAEGYPAVVEFPDGLEVAGGQQIGISELASSANAQVTLTIVGYEY